MKTLLFLLLYAVQPRPLMIPATITSNPQAVAFTPKGTDYTHTLFIEAQDDDGKTYLLLIPDTFPAKKSERIAIVFFTSPDGKTTWREVWHNGKEYRCYLNEYLNAKKQGL